MAQPKVVHGVDGLRSLVGEQVGYSPWQEVTQDQVNLFADATGDHQWIHVDTERAASGPFGQTVAHGFLTLSLITLVLPQVLDVRGFSVAVNYGLDRVRFPAPVPVGARLRGGVVVEEVADVSGGGVQTTYTVTFEVEGGNKPVCVARFLERRYP
jgi:acyl dehydratase